MTETNDLYIVRHGETTGISSERLYGSTDIDLSDLGREQMRRVGDRLQGITFAQAFASPLSRSRESVEIILSGRGPEIEIIEGFREISFGRWEGWTFEEAAERDPENHAEWKKGSLDFRFPEGDHKQDFFNRKAATARDIFTDCQLPALAVLHKGVIKGVLAALLKITLDEVSPMFVELGSIHRLRRAADSSWTLLGTNEADHLGSAHIPSSR